MNAFIFQDPEKIDIVTACGVQLGCRHDIHLWDVRQSDLEGCVELHNRQQLSMLEMDLFSSNALVLALVDALEKAGFAGVDEEVDHSPGRLVFDARRLVGRRAYLQCVFFISKLVAKGVAQFSSVGTQAYFEALLRGKRPVQPGLPAAAYRQILAAERHSDEAPTVMDVVPEPPQRRLRSKKPPPQHSPALVDDGASSDCSVVGGGGLAAESDASSVVGGFDDDHAALVAAPAPAAQAGPVVHLAAAGGIPEVILGAKVTCIPGRRTATQTYSDRLTVRCTNPAHGQCSKSRSLALMRNQFGQRCAEAFLGAWLARAEDMPAAQHMSHAPNVAAMRAYLDAHP